MMQAIVPYSERRTVLAQYHDNRSSGHLGVSKTISKIRQGYYWPGIQSDVRAYIAGCDKCSSLMLGRELEVATPLDIMYEMPLKARMEEAHSAVRYHTGQEMRRQKRYHDAKVNWQCFAKNDKVYVFFPQRKASHSPKFTSYWRGPYTIVGKKSDLLYEVDCGYRGKLQVIHADRLKLHKSQVFADEVVDVDLKADDYEIPRSDGDESDRESNHEGVCSENKRTRRPPVWLQDYVRYLSVV